MGLAMNTDEYKSAASPFTVVTEGYGNNNKT
jgi:hypothetical protein